MNFNILPEIEILNVSLYKNVLKTIKTSDF